MQVATLRENQDLQMGKTRTCQSKGPKMHQKKFITTLCTYRFTIFDEYIFENLYGIANSYQPSMTIKLNDCDCFLFNLKVAFAHQPKAIHQTVLKEQIKEAGARQTECIQNRKKGDKEPKY
jgi:hypothetical protein